MEQAAADARLLATFLEELEDRVRALNEDVLALERDAAPDAPAGPAPERLGALLRTAHSLKGAARAVNVRPVERVSHHLEELLIAVQQGRLAVGPELCSLLLGAADAIEDAGARLRAGQDLRGAPIVDVLARLEAGAGAGAGASGEAGPASAPHAVEATGADGAVRVAAERLDALLAHTGELVIARRRVESRRVEVAALRELAARARLEWRGTEKAVRALAEHPERSAAALRRGLRLTGRTGGLLRRLEAEVEGLAGAMIGDGRLLAQTTDPLDDDVRRIRMVRFAEACGGLERTVRDVARATGKEITVVIEGGDVELDRSVVEGVKDPLRHLVRNAADHGLEPPAERRAGGKNSQGRITVGAALRGAQVEITVRDDGRGLDLAGLRERARAAGLAAPEEAHEAARLVFEPGVSTARAVTDVSGRGVGLDVVKTGIEALHGTVGVAVEPGGSGVCFILTVPLTLTSLPALVVTVGQRTFALASANVAALLRFAPADLRSVGGRPMLPHGGRLVPVLRLADSVQLVPEAPSAERAKVVAALVTAGESRVAFVVDELVAAHDVVVKSLGRRLRHLAGVSGATILPSGGVALVLNAAHLVRRALSGTPGTPFGPSSAGTVAPRKRVLLADDSVTTRALERSLLEAAGYEVVLAADGRAAWRLLEDNVPDLVVSDIDMPGMDGFALTEAIRSSPRLRDLPVVLVTGRESPEDKARGLRAGASAYVVKSAFDQKTFLDLLASLA